jgi:hypothetical protein
MSHKGEIFDSVADNLPVPVAPNVSSFAKVVGTILGALLASFPCWSWCAAYHFLVMEVIVHDASSVLLDCLHLWS